MQDKVFIDSNVILYFFVNDENKKEVVYELFLNNPIISIQVINEISNVLLKKYSMAPDKIRDEIEFLKDFVELQILTLPTVFLALKIKDKYKFSYYDSLIIASALENGCKVLYSEDMQHNQVIEDKLTIINPFTSC